MDKQENLAWFLLLGFCLFLVLLPSFLSAAFLHTSVYNNSSDTFLYLDIARNLREGRGPVISFNAYQFWPGSSYPALPFVHIGLPLILALFWPLAQSVKGIILAGFPLAVANGLLIALIVARLYRDRALAFWSAVIVVSSVCTQITLLRILTEQMSLFLTLLAVLLFMSPSWRGVKRGLLLTGLLFIGFLVRSASVFYLFLFGLAMFIPRGGDVSHRKAAWAFLAATAVLFALWQGFIFFYYGSFFPQYPLAFKNYFIATRSHGGMFFGSLPALIPLPEHFCSSDTILVNLRQMFIVLFCVLRVLIIPAVWGAFWALRRGSRPERLLSLLALGVMLAHVVFYPFMEIGEFNWTRFLLVPVVCLVILAGRALRDFCAAFLPRLGEVLFHFVFAAVLAANMYQSARVLNVYWQEALDGRKEKALKSARAWVLAETQADDLIGVSEYLLGNIYLERPLVVLPSYKTLSENNLNDFLYIFKPRALIFEDTMPLDIDVLEKNGYHIASKEVAESPLLIYKKRGP